MRFLARRPPKKGSPRRCPRRPRPASRPRSRPHRERKSLMSSFWHGRSRISSSSRLPAGDHEHDRVLDRGPTRHPSKDKASDTRRRDVAEALRRRNLAEEAGGEEVEHLSGPDLTRHCAGWGAGGGGGGVCVSPKTHEGAGGRNGRGRAHSLTAGRPRDGSSSVARRRCRLSC